MLGRHMWRPSSQTSFHTEGTLETHTLEVSNSSAHVSQATVLRWVLLEDDISKYVALPNIYFHPHHSSPSGRTTGQDQARYNRLLSSLHAHKHLSEAAITPKARLLLMAVNPMH